MWFAAQSLNSQTEFTAKMSHILTTHISQFHVLQLLPDAFIGVEIRRIGRQLFKLNVSGPARLHKLPHLFAMNRRAIPDYHQLTLDLKAQVFEKPDTVSAVQRPVANQRV